MTAGQLPADSFREQAQAFVDQKGRSLGCDFTYSPMLPEGRGDIAAVRRSVENGRTYGYDIIYLIWRGRDGQLKGSELIKSHETRDYLRIGSIRIENEEVVVDVQSGGTMSKKGPWKETFRVPLSELF